MAEPSPRTVLDYATRVFRTPKPPLGRRTRWIVIISCLMGVALFAMYAFVPHDIPTGDPKLFQLLRPGVRTTLQILILPGIALLLLSCVILIRRKRTVLGVLILPAIPVLFFLSAGRVLLHNLGRGTIRDHVIAADGNRYCLVSFDVSDDSTTVAARVKSAGLFYETIELLHDSHYRDSSLLVVRPMPFKTVEFGALYSTPSGFLVGLRGGNCCDLVYDLANKRFYGENDIGELSPFLLLNATSQLYAPDEAEIIRFIRDPNAVVRPSRNALSQALTHPNPAVRQSAARILKAMERTEQR